MLNTLKETIITDLLSISRIKYEKNKSEINDKIKEISLEMKNEQNYAGSNRIKVFFHDYSINKKYAIEHAIVQIVLSFILGMFAIFGFIFSYDKDFLFFVVSISTFFILFLAVSYFELPQKTKKSLRFDQLKKQLEELDKNNNNYVKMLKNIFSEKQCPNHLSEYPISLTVLNEIKKEFSNDMIKDLLMKGNNKEIKYNHLIKMVKEKQKFLENERAFKIFMQQQ